MATAKKTAAPKRVVKPIIKDVYAFSVDRATIYFTKNGVDHSRASFTFAAVEVSCGIAEVDGLTSLQACIKNGVPVSIAKKALTASIADVKKRMEVTFVLLSNNKKSPDANRIAQTLSSTSTGWRKNPSSGNLIKVWIV